MLTFTVFAASWFRHATFRSTTYDLAVFEQVLWRMAHGRGATSTLTAWNTFADHLSPVLLVFVPLYRVAPSPLWLFAAQALALGLGALCIRPLAVAVGLDRDAAPATFLVAAYAVYPAVWNAAIFDFHPTTMAVPVLLVGCTAALRQSYRGLWLAAAGLVVLRDDLALAAAALACIGWRTATTRGRQARVALIFAAAAWTVIGAQLGAAWGASRHFTARYGYLGASMSDAAAHPVRSVVGLAEHVFAGNNAYLAAALLLPLAFLPLLRPVWLALAVFVALPSLGADDANIHSPLAHYGAPIAPFLLLAAAGALRYFSDGLRERVAAVAVALSVSAFAVIGPVGNDTLTWDSVDPGDARAAVAFIQDGDAVVANNVIGPHVAHRDVLLPFPFPFVKANVLFPLDERVQSTSLAKQRRIDAVIIGNRRAKSRRLLRSLMANPEISARFDRTDFGTVTVFRRRT